jgi:alanine racemase
MALPFPSRLSIDLGAVTANWRLLNRRVGPGASCAAVVKADAYGLGMEPVALALSGAGCHVFFVAHLEEALALRALLPRARIANLGGLLPGAGPSLVEARIVPVLNHLGEIEAWRALAHRQERILPALIHLDTGMNRLGLGPEERSRLSAAAAASSSGWFGGGRTAGGTSVGGMAQPFGLCR